MVEFWSFLAGPGQAGIWLGPYGHFLVNLTNFDQIGQNRHFLTYGQKWAFKVRIGRFWQLWIWLNPYGHFGQFRPNLVKLIIWPGQI